MISMPGAAGLAARVALGAAHGGVARLGAAHAGAAHGAPTGSAPP